MQMMKSHNRMRVWVSALGLLCLIVGMMGCGASPVDIGESTQTLQTQTEPQTVASTQPSHSGELKIHFIDVGQADAALVQCDGHNMLIDGGNVEDSNLMYTYLNKQGVTHLDYVIGTHAHEDHIGGLAGALHYASVDTVYCPVTSYSSQAFENFSKAVSAHGAEITVPSVDHSFSLGDAYVQILAVNTGEDTNNTSIVLRIDYGSTGFLFTGDAESPLEQDMLDREVKLKATVLKVGHHGAATSSSYQFLRSVMPEYAVISVGKANTYGHPEEEVLSRLRDADTKLYRTDMQGDIICISDGSCVTFSVSRNPEADTFDGIAQNSAQSVQLPTEQSEQTEPVYTQVTQLIDYIINKNTGVFHSPDCAGVKRMKESNKESYTGTKEDLISQGYIPCQNCNP